MTPAADFPSGTASGTKSGRKKVLVTIFQRGAMDGLAAVTPLDQERWLNRLRFALMGTFLRRLMLWLDTALGGGERKPPKWWWRAGRKLSR